MPKRLTVTAIVTISLAVAVFLLVLPSSAMENTCNGFTTTTFNGLPACTDDGRLHLCASNFPNANFRYYLVEELGLSTRDMLENKAFIDQQTADEVLEIKCPGKFIDSLKGICYFRNLSGLNCNGNSLSELDLSRNNNLTELNCGNNKLVSLTVISPSLKTLACAYNQLTNLDAVYAPNLEVLDCNYNSLTHLSFTLKYLTSLTCRSNQLKYLDLRGFPALKNLYCNENQIVALEPFFTPHLTLLECTRNQITELDIANCPDLVSLNCRGNQLTSLDVTGLSKLENLLCGENQLKELNFSGTKLVYLDCEKNQITRLEIHETIETLYCNDNHLEILDLKNALGLNYLRCDNNRLTSLNPPSWSQIRDASIGYQYPYTPIVCPPDPDRVLDLSTLIGTEILAKTERVSADYSSDSPYYDRPLNIKGRMITLPDGAFTLGISAYVDISSPHTERVYMFIAFQVQCHHSWEPATCKAKATCLHCREHSGSFGEHSWKESTDTYPKYCSVCGKTDGHPLKHVWRDATCTAPKICTYCTETEGQPKGHTWKAIAPCASKTYCSVCFATQECVTSAAHTFVKKDCSYNICSVCQIEEPIKNPEHTMVKVDCIYQKCTQCDYTARLPSVEHVYVKVSCTEKVCTECNIQIGLHPADHNYSERTLFTRPHCLDCGKKHTLSFLTYALLPITATVSCLEWIAAIWYLWDYKRERKY